MLTDEHLNTLDSLNKRDGRAIYLPELMQHPDYPFYDFSDNELAKEASGEGDDKPAKKEGGKGTRDSAVHQNPAQQQQKSKNKNDDDDENNLNQDEQASILDANYNQDFDEMSPGVEV